MKYITKLEFEPKENKHEFVILVNGELKSYNRYEDIPDVFDNVIKFLPVIPPGPHTDEQHEEIHQWEMRFKTLMEKEKQNASRNKNR
jgi:hypothetical protein